ncbi:MAG: hypothetical protein NUW01_16915 [Gemmatimonadaceae bacterium]|nr:hypothetical protein [Gemmatimonadaceae bacterium]
MTRPKGIDWDAVFAERPTAGRAEIARGLGVSPQAVSAAFAVRQRPCSEGCRGGHWCAKNWLRLLPKSVMGAPGARIAQDRCGGGVMRISIANGTSSFAIEMWDADHRGPSFVEAEEFWGRRRLGTVHEEDPAAMMRLVRGWKWSARWLK